MKPSRELVTVSKVQFRANTILGNHSMISHIFARFWMGATPVSLDRSFREGHSAETVFRPADETHSVHFNDVETHMLIIDFIPSCCNVLRSIAGGDGVQPCAI
jgi:hypothetical protein